MKSPKCFKVSPWTIVSLDKCLLGQKSPWPNIPGTKWSLDKCPLDKCINTPKNLGVDTFQDPVGHFRAPLRHFWILQAVSECTQRH